MKKTSSGVDTFFITNNTRSPIPRVPFSTIKEKVLGKKYQLSLVFIGDQRMQTYNRRYRSKNTPTDILSFPLNPDSGEVFLNLHEVSKRAKFFEMSEKNYLAFLFIHGCLHLKGYEHGRTMEKQEDTWCKRFKIQKPKR